VMKTQGVLKVTNEELRKLKVIEQIIEKRMKQKKAARLLVSYGKYFQQI